VAAVTSLALTLTLTAPAHAVVAPATARAAAITWQGTVGNGTFYGAAFAYAASVTETDGVVEGSCSVAFSPTTTLSLDDPWTRVDCWVEGSYWDVRSGSSIPLTWASTTSVLGTTPAGSARRLCMTAYISQWGWDWSYADYVCVPFV
jgi:hypothetical protein